MMGPMPDALGAATVAALPLDRVVAGPLHHDPPFRVTDFFRGRRLWLLVPAALFVFLALGAAIAHGELLHTWDEPIQHFVEGHRTEVLDPVFLTISGFGSTLTVLALGTGLAAMVWRRCRAVSIAIVVAMLGRPIIEATLKILVDRDRPDFERLVPGNGPSFPSGHPMAAVALYGFVPVVVALYTHRKAVVYAAWVISLALIGGIAASRVYLGVHWFSDVVASILLAAFMLIAIEWVIERAHVLGGCTGAGGCAELDPDLEHEIDADLASLDIEHASVLDAVAVRTPGTT
jgi:undecaprenyl-diphosphatase